MNNDEKKTKISVKLLAWFGIVLIVLLAVLTGVRIAKAYLSERDGDVGIASADVTSDSLWIIRGESGFSTTTTGSGCFYYADSTGKTWYFGGSTTSYQKRFVESTAGWLNQTWTWGTGVSSVAIRGQNVFYDLNDNTYFASGNAGAGKVLRLDQATWNLETHFDLFYNYTGSFTGMNVWNNGEYMFYSNGATQLVYDETNAWWRDVSVSGDITSFNGQYIWNDVNGDVYLSNGSNTYYVDIYLDEDDILNVETTLVSGTGLNINGQYVWTDGTNVFYSYDGVNRKWNGTDTFEDIYYLVPTSRGFNYFITNDGTLYCLTDTYVYGCLNPTPEPEPVEPEPIEPGNNNTSANFASNPIAINTAYLENSRVDFYDGTNAYFWFTADETYTNDVTSEYYHKVVVSINLRAFCRYKDSDGVPIGVNSHYVNFAGEFVLDYTADFIDNLTTGTYTLNSIETGYDYAKVYVGISTNSLDNVNFSSVTFTSFIGDGTPQSNYAYNHENYFYDDVTLRTGSKSLSIRFMRNLFYTDSASYQFRTQFGWSQIGYPRTYFITSDLSDNAYYSQGYSYGYDYGYADGSDNGYQLGYDAGYSVGGRVGYELGIADGNDYTFIGLIGSVVDAPISAFTSMFNFDVLGINLTSFLESLFSLCIVITIVKFVLVK